LNQSSVDAVKSLVGLVETFGLWINLLSIYLNHFIMQIHLLSVYLNLLIVKLNCFNSFESVKILVAFTCFCS